MTTDMGATRQMLVQIGCALNNVLSFLVFCLLDLLDAFLCIAYSLLDSAIESRRKRCYCCPTPNDHVAAKVQLEGVSSTLYARRSVINELTKHAKAKCLDMLQCQRKPKRSSGCLWSDCDCTTCNSWSYSPAGGSLFVHVEGPKADEGTKEDVLFIHGFASSSAFWTETVFPNFSRETRASYRLLAIDLLGFGRSPKPPESLYTLAEHIEMIEQTLDMHKVGSFHIVAHSLGSILAVALAARHPETVKSLTLVAPPYFPASNGKESAQDVMRQLAPRRVWPVTAFGVSLACWYEHISRTICLLICKNHRLWEIILKLLTLNRVRTFLIESFFCHTHNAAWHTLHNIICGSGSKMDGYLDVLREEASCNMTVLHGCDDSLIPVDCSHAIRSKVPRAQVKVLDDKDHLGIVLGRQAAFAGELVEIWKNSS